MQPCADAPSVGSLELSLLGALSVCSPSSHKAAPVCRAQEEAFLQRGLASDTSIASGLAQSDGASPPGLHGFAPRSAGGDGGGDGGLMGLRSGSGGALSPHGVPVRSSSFSDRDHCEASPSLGGGRAWASDSPRVGLATPGGATLRGGAGGQPPHLHHSSHPRHHRHHAQPPPVEYAEKVNWAKARSTARQPPSAAWCLIDSSS